MESSNPRNPAIGMLYYSLMREDIQVAASWFERAVEEREPMLIPHLRHPLMKPLRASPRWPVLARMMNLPQSIE
jgi:hypothetical protein